MPRKRSLTEAAQPAPVLAPAPAPAPVRVVLEVDADHLIVKAKEAIQGLIEWMIHGAKTPEDPNKKIAADTKGQG